MTAPLQVRLPDALLTPAQEARRGLLVAVDGGATHSRCYVYDPDRSAGWVANGSGCNPQAIGAKRAAEALRLVIGEALEHAGSEPVAAVLCGVAGVEREADERALADELDDDPRLGTVTVTSDVVVAWAGSNGAQPAVTAIAGTGSNVLGVGDSWQARRCGGWGHVLGDEGSGYAVGLAGLVAAVRTADGRQEATRLLQAAMQRYEAGEPKDLQSQVFALEDMKAGIASFASVVVGLADEQDRDAQAVVAIAADGLAELVATVHASFAAEGEQLPVFLVGSLAQSDSTYKVRLLEALVRRDVRTAVADAQRSPLEGAALLAARIAGQAAPQSFPEVP